MHKIVTKDCLDFLHSLDDKCADLAIIDPPYNLKVAEWDTFGTHRGFLDFTFGWLDALIPKLKKTGSLYVFNTPFNSAFILQHLHEAGMVFQNWITWDKRDGVSYAKTRYANGQETILFFTRSRRHTFNCDDIRQPYESTERMRHAAVKGILKNGKRWFPHPGGKLCGEVWHITSERHKNKVRGKVQKPPHATIKPTDMIERIVRASSNEDDLVVDCFAGSGTTATVCKRLGRNFIGCDSDPTYAEMARKALEV